MKDKKILIFRLPVDERGNIIIPYQEVAQFVNVIQECVSDTYNVIACPATMVLSDDYKNIGVVPELTKKEFYKLIGKEYKC